MKLTSASLEERIAIAIRRQRRTSASALLHDPIEDLAGVRPLIRQAEKKADAFVGAAELWGRCHQVWDRTKTILQDEHGITWYSPAEMNPEVCFD